MAAITAAPEYIATRVPRWAVLLLATMVGLLWLVSFEGGAVSTALGQASNFLHESFHDGRHLLGVPCH